MQYPNGLPDYGKVRLFEVALTGVEWVVSPTNQFKGGGQSSGGSLVRR